MKSSFALLKITLTFVAVSLISFEWSSFKTNLDINWIQASLRSFIKEKLKSVMISFTIKILK